MTTDRDNDPGYSMAMEYPSIGMGCARMPPGILRSILAPELDRVPPQWNARRRRITDCQLSDFSFVYIDIA
ncbi:hypothetical protein [Cupriavidus gilardii]|uniref:hypothetical protein n=1 Tax=Cupriavidus gilardii TaxID=82541 RepID=UPI0021BFF17B|nr:hypothetical protein [Cupriavidus gilardii]MCT9123393.1 hypothetical protein [Cupriavidus gilardii]